MANPGRWIELLGADEETLVEHLGPPVARRVAGAHLWLLFETPAGQARVRCRTAAGSGAVAASWSLSLAEPAGTLRQAVAPLGLWPAAAPDEDAATLRRPLVRRPLPVAGSAPGSLHSLTATVRSGRFTQVSVFDEPPDWR